MLELIILKQFNWKNIIVCSSKKNSFALHSRWVHPKYTWSRTDVGSSRSTSFIKFFLMENIFCSLAPFSCYSRKPPKTILVFGEQTDIPNSVLFSIQVQIEFLQIVFPSSTKGQQAGVRTRFVRQEPRVLQCLTMIWAILCFGGRIQISGHSDSEIFNNVGASSIFTWV